ncbi:hypothetical protein M378DRAFT_854396 [Amanita muscaria Koide BX008]|uniref:Uncharacterized protein n=1 Tax=Amanita muscaria (strain Koide BX008) TaxID=946122 RepID=A0A0C2SET9_AMAMK|nr:hypothetical protein M378DRAFT_854396 [Amanita muscaria Koide BX008]
MRRIISSPYVPHDPPAQPPSPGARTNLRVVLQDGTIVPIGGEEAEMRIGWMKIEKLIQRIFLNLEWVLRTPTNINKFITAFKDRLVCAISATYCTREQ